MLIIRKIMACAFLLPAFVFLASSARAITVGLVTINQQALFFNQINEGANAEAKKQGAQLVIFNANNQPTAQNSAIEDYVAQKVDAIIVIAIDVNGIKPAITTAKQAGIPVIAIDARIPNGDNATFIGVDNKSAGEQIGKYVVEWSQKNDKKLKIGFVGALNSAIQNERLDGFKAAIQAGKINATFADTVDGQNVQDVALTASENLLTGNPDLNAIYATGEPALVGSISALTSQNRTKDISLFGWDLTEQAIRGIDEGWIVAVVQQDPAQEGRRAVDAAVKLKKGETVPVNVDVPVTIVTKENVDKFRTLFKK
ncbi:MAG TPA: substrate-binding domain-containing protein [Chthoniobacterales bacterium]|jgi:ribose transport system substrate-binding protein|nr:substrate-binding domain-containing protein [Chthoniobacterales bacterium]